MFTLVPVELYFKSLPRYSRRAVSACQQLTCFDSDRYDGLVECLNTHNEHMVLKRSVFRGPAPFTGI